MRLLQGHGKLHLRQHCRRSSFEMRLLGIMSVQLSNDVDDHISCAKLVCILQKSRAHEVDEDGFEIAGRVHFWPRWQNGTPAAATAASVGTEAETTSKRRRKRQQMRDAIGGRFQLFTETVRTRSQRPSDVVELSNFCRWYKAN